MSTINTVTPPNDLELAYFYKCIVLFFEKDFDSLRAHLSDDQVQAILYYAGIVWIPYPDNYLLKAPIEYKTQAKPFVLFKKRGGKEGDVSSLISFLRHLRNCFAHGHFNKIEFDGVPYFCLEDFSTRGNLTMVAQLPLRQFYLLVESIKVGVSS